MNRRKKSTTDNHAGKGRQALPTNSSALGRKRIFADAAGKTIDSMHYTCNPPDWRALEIRFTDGTLFSFELLPRVDLRCQYLDSKGGDLEVIRSYDISSDK